ncbi:MAG: RNA polymerase sigma factor [Deltaproteobacteria bacterium]|nr:RNA polymerase sigma factor [Deltaproteobacteria bacterium]
MKGSTRLASPRDVLIAAHPMDESFVEARPKHDLETLYRAHASDVARWAGRLGGPAVDVEDVVHEVFLVVRGELAMFRGEAKLTTWLYRITLNVVRHHRRKQRLASWFGWAEEGATPADVLLERKEEIQTLYRVLDTLPEKYRTVLVLHEIEEKSGPEIAELTDVTVSTVWVRLHRGRKLFLRALDRLEKGARR